MKRRLLIAAALILTCSGCVAYPYYYDAPYYYSTPYDYYRPYYPYSYRPPAVYTDPGWFYFYPNLYLDFSFRGGHHSRHGGRRH